MTDTFFSLENFSSLVFGWFLNHGLAIIFILVAALVINRFSGVLVERFIRRMVPPSEHLHSTGAERKREDTLIRILLGTLRIVVWIIAILTILSEIGINIGPIIAAAGVVGLALGFGGQYLIKDLITGFFIILENQYRTGDVVCFDGTCGLVEDISLRATIMRDLDGVVHHVPHGSIIRVSNMAKKFARVNLDIGVSYSADLAQVIKVVNETGEALANDAEWKDKILKPMSFARVEDFADSAVIVKILGETVPLEQWAVAGEFRMRLKLAFDAALIEIPFPQMVVHTSTK
jgi:small conductance mechanosensitive channel